ncbi:MAG: sigma-54-dependent Fis family transcriptional regulator [Deltaproteobacteria bacterium]|nr:sigma-54-dependent Fis family transcriptional regulator [Deltaproteobacteria bacterium]
MLAREVELDTILSVLGTRIARAMRAERATVYLVDGRTSELRSRVADLPELDEIRLPKGRGIAGFVAETGEVVNVRDAARDPRHFPDVDRKTGFVTRTILAAPIRDAARRRVILGVVQVLNKQDGAFTEEDEAFLHALASQVAMALEGTTLRPASPTDRGVALRGPFNHIVGHSPAMRAVYSLIQRAAQTDATVLLRGETGVGKGLFARAIHANCKRSDGPSITVDCTTLPAPLVESELFGHERGAYTGADRRVQGKVELAQGGTLFLDEVGDLPAPAQAKLLRFLQERTFERVGGRETLRADVRIVAATHRKLEDLVARGELREDLFYRLRVVEIFIPPLRARGPDEIESLARHFLDQYGRRHDRVGVQLSAAALSALRRHPWPGNVRELEHAIERAVVLAPTTVIDPEHLGLVPLEALGRRAPGSPVSAVDEGGSDAVTLPLGLSLDEVERRYVEATLSAQGGNLTRTAEALAVGRNTLKRKVRPRPERDRRGR